MSISWGSWDTSGNNAMRVGIETSVSSVGNSTSSCTITWKVYTENRYSYSDNNQRIEYSGNKSGSTTFNNQQGSGTRTLRDTFTTSHSYSNWGKSPGKHTVTAQVAGTYNGSTPSKTVSVTIPARPYASPAAPSGVSVSRSSDNRAVVSWNRNNTSGRPWTRVRIQRKRNGSSWSSGATVSGTSSSYASDTGANAYYEYRLRSENSVGNSGWVESGYYRTSPAAPSSVKASRSGADIRVTWSNTSVAYSSFTTTIQRQVNGGSWSTVATGLSSNATAWRDTNIVAGGEHRYRVRNVESVQALTSDWSMTNLVATEVAPNAPTQLKPDGVTMDGSKPITLTWQHNPGADNADQTAFRIERAVAGDGSSWTYVATVNSDLSRWVAPAGTFANGTVWRWRVETKGSHADWSPKATAATLTTASAPSVTVTSPSGVLTELPPVVEWTYAQTEARPQNRAEVRLYEDGSQARLWTVTTAATTLTMSGYPFEDGKDYRVGVRARSADGLWSTEATTDFSVDLLPPAAVDLTPQWDRDTGVAIIELTASDAVPGESSPVDFVHVQRRIDEGEWVTIFRDIELDPSETVLDTKPSLVGVHEYRAVVWSEAPSAAITDPVSLSIDGWGFGPTQTRWCFLSYGDGFATILRAQGDPDLSEERGRARSAVPVAGRREPLLLVGETLTRTLPVSFTLVGDSSTADEFLTASDEADAVLWRDFTGARVHGLLSDVSIKHRPGAAEVSFSIEQTWWDENVAEIEVPAEDGED